VNHPIVMLVIIARIMFYNIVTKEESTSTHSKKGHSLDN